MLVISFESPPGGGKGFLLKHIAAKGLHPYSPVIALHDDAIDHIVDLNTDETRWAFFTEMYFLHTHVRCYEQAVAGAIARPGQQHHQPLVLLEGSPATDWSCHFARLGMHRLEAALYSEWFGLMRCKWHVDASIMLLSDMHAHMERIIDNAKVEQAGLKLDDIHGMIETYAQALPGAYVLPCPANFEDNEPVLEALRAVVLRIIRQHTITLESSASTEVATTLTCHQPGPSMP
jgi:deoxyadenosine/deoxycytidine kinase